VALIGTNASNPFVWPQSVHVRQVGGSRTGFGSISRLPWRGRRPLRDGDGFGAGGDFCRHGLRRRSTRLPVTSRNAPNARPSIAIWRRQNISPDGAERLYSLRNSAYAGLNSSLGPIGGRHALMFDFAQVAHRHPARLGPA
jgi:hypothetical protein